MKIMLHDSIYYRSMLHIYSKRLGRAKVKYAKMLKGLRKDIRHNEYFLSKALSREKEVRDLHKKARLYFGFKISKENDNDKSIEARGFFFKYCIDVGVKAAVVSRYINMSPEIAAKRRRFLLRKFKTDKLLKERYERFVDFMKN